MQAAAAVLGVGEGEVAPERSFRQLGGDSLAAVQVRVAYMENPGFCGFAAGCHGLGCALERCQQQICLGLPILEVQKPPLCSLRTGWRRPLARRCRCRPSWTTPTPWRASRPRWRPLHPNGHGQRLQ